VEFILTDNTVAFKVDIGRIVTALSESDSFLPNIIKIMKKTILTAYAVLFLTMCLF
jgi:hypothetical protein